jgi:hypothetical protein
VAAVLGRLMPRPKPRSEKRAMIEASLGAIYAARDRGCTWAEIAEGLAEAGMVITSDALRCAVNERPRDLKTHPRTIEVRTPKRKSKRPSPNGAVEETADGGRAVRKPNEKRNGMESGGAEPLHARSSPAKRSSTAGFEGRELPEGEL